MHFYDNHRLCHPLQLLLSARRLLRLEHRRVVRVFFLSPNAICQNTVHSLRHPEMYSQQLAKVTRRVQTARAQEIQQQQKASGVTNAGQRHLTSTAQNNDGRWLTMSKANLENRFEG